MRHLGVLAALSIAIVGCSIVPQFASASSAIKPSDTSLKNGNKTSVLSLSETYEKQQTNAKLVAVTDTDKANKTDDTTKKTTEKTAKKPAETPAPVDVNVTVKDGDSLTSIAAEHNTDWTRLFDANESLADPNTITPGETIRIPRADEQLPDRVSQIVVATPVATVASGATQQAATSVSRQYTAAPVSSNSYYVGNGMWCTDYVHSRRPDVPIYGNAGYNWVSAAQAQGRATGSAPRAGAVAVTNGHVAYVESVNGDGTYTVSEMGWNYKAGNYNKRTVQSGTFGEFIY